MNYQNKFNPNPKFSSTETLPIKYELERLLTKEVVKPTKHELGEIISPIVVREKKDGRFRFILNLKELNKCVTYTHLEWTHYKQTIINLTSPNCFMVSVDLKDAYYTILVH